MKNYKIYKYLGFSKKGNCIGRGYALFFGDVCLSKLIPAANYIKNVGETTEISQYNIYRLLDEAFPAEFVSGKQIIGYVSKMNSFEALGEIGLDSCGNTFYWTKTLDGNIIADGNFENINEQQCPDDMEFVAKYNYIDKNAEMRSLVREKLSKKMKIYEEE